MHYWLCPLLIELGSIPANDSVDSSYGSEAPPPSYEISTFNSIDDIYSIISAGPELDSSSYITLNPACKLIPSH